MNCIELDVIDRTGTEGGKSPEPAGVAEGPLLHLALVAFGRSLLACSVCPSTVHTPVAT